TRARRRLETGRKNGTGYHRRPFPRDSLDAAMTKYFRPLRFLVLCVSSVVLGSGSLAQPESNRRMAERLRAITASADPIKSPFEFSARARQLGDSLAQADQTEKMKHALPYANLLLHAGELEAAIG